MYGFYIPNGGCTALNGFSMDKRDDYVTMMRTMTSTYFNKMYSNMEYYIKVFGTDVIVRRVSDDNEMKKSLGSAYLFDGNQLDGQVETFTCRIVINRSQMINRYNSSNQDIEFYYNKDLFRVGDQLEFETLTHKMRYKVNNIEAMDTHGLAQLYKIELGGYEEYKINK